MKNTTISEKVKIIIWWNDELPQTLLEMSFVFNPFSAVFWRNPFKPEFTIVIFIHYKPRIAAAILDL